MICWKACIWKVLPDVFRAPITQLPADDQHLTRSLPLVVLCSGALEIAYISLREPFQPHTEWRPLQHTSSKSFVRVTDGISLPAGHPLWPLETSTFSVVEKHPSSVNIAWVHCPVLWGIDPSDFVGYQVERIHIMPAPLPLPIHWKRFPPQFSCPPWSSRELERNSMPVFWLFHRSLYLARCHYQWIEWFREALEARISWPQCESIVILILDISNLQVFEQPVQ